MRVPKLPFRVFKAKYEILQLYTNGRLGITVKFRSRPEVFCKKVVLRNFAKSTEKHLCQSLSFKKIAWLSQQLY